MFDGPIEVNIGNICGGAVPELFDHEVKRLLANVADLNTDPEAKRSLTIEFKFKPADGGKCRTEATENISRFLRVQLGSKDIPIVS